MRNKEVVEKYEAGLSVRVISDDTGIPATTVRRILKRSGVVMRTHQEAQKLALDSGRTTHPTKGKKRSEELRLQIGRAISEQYELVPEDEKERRIEAKRKLWESKSPDEISAFRDAGLEAIHNAAEHGSKFENFVCGVLEENNYPVITHKKHLFGSSELEIDILLPTLNTIVEIDGPAHFHPIWGQDKLDKTRFADEKKNGLLVGAGFAVIRIQNKGLGGKVSKTKMLAACDKLIKRLKEIEGTFPPVGQRIIEIEV